jgi:hypothetical protein
VQRQAFKGAARKGGLIAAFVIGLIWARENVKNDDWGTARFGAPTTRLISTG